MTTAIVIGVVALFGLALVASQLVRLREWLGKAPPPAEPPADEWDEK